MTPSRPTFAHRRQAGGGRRAVSSVSDLRDALADPSISHVLLLPSEPVSWNFSREQWPASVHIHRPVVMEGVLGGDGKPPHGERRCLRAAAAWHGRLSYQSPASSLAVILETSLSPACLQRRHGLQLCARHQAIIRTWRLSPAAAPCPRALHRT